MDRRSVGWSAAMLGITGLALAIARRRQESNAAQKLKGKVVFITGGSRGLGFAMARELASLGARLALTSRNVDELQRAKAHLLAHGDVAADDIWTHACDVSVESQIRETVSAAIAHFGRIDVLVNNAGIIMVGPLESHTLDSFRQAMNVNFFGAVYTTFAVLPHMLARGDGAIVNIGSIGGKVAFPHLLPYVASKFAVTGWSQGLRAELAGKGIRVTTVSPGIMRTGSHIQARFAGNTEEEYRWFSSWASFPGTAANATSAARKIVKALVRGPAEISIGLQAIVAARSSNLAPELTAAMLSFANGLLPAAPAGRSEFWDADRSVEGKAYRGSLPGVLERLGTGPIQRYNQEAVPLADT